MPSNPDFASLLASPKSASFGQQLEGVHRRSSVDPRQSEGHDDRRSTEQAAGGHPTSGSSANLPLPVTTPGEVGKKAEKPELLKVPAAASNNDTIVQGRGSKSSLAEADGFLLPARNPPPYSFFDLFPFSLLVKFLTHRGKKVKGKKGALLRAKLQSQSVTHNLPLEISLYLVRFAF